MATILLRYRNAVHSKSLRTVSHKGDEGSAYLDVDVLGAVGLAAKYGHELGVGLERLFSGDARAASEIVDTLQWMVWSRAETQRMKPKLTRLMALDMARKCLAWHRHGTCQDCNGLGKDKLKDGNGRDTNTLSNHDCQSCRGSGKILFEAHFRYEHKDLARWLVAQMELESSRVGPAAMAFLAPRLEM